MNHEGCQIERYDASVHGDALAVYSQLVGLQERRYPRLNEFSTKLSLPPSLLGSYLDFVEPPVTAVDQKDFRESKQSVFWDESWQKFSPGPVVVGQNFFILDKNPLSKFFGKKPIFTYHSHDGRHQSDMEFLGGDVGTVRAKPRAGYIFAIASPLGGPFIFQTEKSAKLPISSTALTYYEMFRYLVPMILKVRKLLQQNPTASFDQVIEYAHATYFSDDLIATGGKRLHRLGFATYLYRPGTGKEYFDQARRNGITIDLIS